MKKKKEFRAFKPSDLIGIVLILAIIAVGTGMFDFSALDKMIPYDEWKVKIYERVDFSNGKWEEQEYTVFKDLHCWEAEVTFNIRDGDYTTWLVFRLKAFPKIPIGLFRTTYQRARPGIQR